MTRAKKQAKHTTLHLTQQADDLRHALADKLGVSLTDVVEMAIRALGEREGIRIGQFTDQSQRD